MTNPTPTATDARDTKIAELRNLCWEALICGIQHVWNCNRRMVLSLPCNCGAEDLAARLRAAAEGE